jgi:uncharacterized protein YjbI with pentapeptide repeats
MRPTTRGSHQPASLTTKHRQPKPTANAISNVTRTFGHPGALIKSYAKDSVQVSSARRLRTDIRLCRTRHSQPYQAFAPRVHRPTSSVVDAPYAIAVAPSSVYLVLAVFVASFVVFVVMAYRRGWSWTGFTSREGNKDTPNRKTLWEWLQLLLIPLALTAAAFLLNQLQADRDQRREDQRASSQIRAALEASRERALGAYLDEMGRLMVDDGLRQSEYGSTPRVLARALTLRVLAQLDGRRKAAVVQFLREAQLITRENAVINLRDADLRYAVFAHAIVSDVRLSAARLSDADFRGADITSSRFNAADLRRADFARAFGGIAVGAPLPRTEFKSANLAGADFSDAHVDAAILDGADLSGSSFAEATLIGARLSYACLSHADFRGADLRSATLDGLGHGVRLARAKLAGAYGTRSSSPGRPLIRFPNGWRQTRGWGSRANSAERSCGHADVRPGHVGG